MKQSNPIKHDQLTNTKFKCIWVVVGLYFKVKMQALMTYLLYFLYMFLYYVFVRLSSKIMIIEVFWKIQIRKIKS